MIGIVSSPEPFKVKDVVWPGPMILYGCGRVSNFLRSFNLLNIGSKILLSVLCCLVLPIDLFPTIQKYAGLCVLAINIRPLLYITENTLERRVGTRGISFLHCIGVSPSSENDGND